MKNKAIKLYKLGKTAPEISVALCLPLTTIQMFLRREKKKFKKYHTVSILYSKDASIDDIVKKTNIKENEVIELLTSVGLLKQSQEDLLDNRLRASKLITNDLENKKYNLLNNINTLKEEVKILNDKIEQAKHQENVIHNEYKKLIVKKWTTRLKKYMAILHDENRKLFWKSHLVNLLVIDVVDGKSFLTIVSESKFQLELTDDIELDFTIFSKE